MSAPSFTALTLATLIATGCGSPAATPDATAPPPLRVATTRATAIDRPERLEAGGIVIARESATLAARIMAAVTAVHVRAGDRVREIGRASCRERV